MIKPRWHISDVKVFVHVHVVGICNLIHSSFTDTAEILTNIMFRELQMTEYIKKSFPDLHLQYIIFTRWRPWFLMKLGERENRYQTVIDRFWLVGGGGWLMSHKIEGANEANQQTIFHPIIRLTHTSVMPQKSINKLSELRHRRFLIFQKNSVKTILSLWRKCWNQSPELSALKFRGDSCLRLQSKEHCCHHISSHREERCCH